MTVKANSIISNDELDAVYQQMTEKSKGTSLNAYDTYLEECRPHESTKVDSKGKKLQGVEEHHIIPHFEGGLDTRAPLARENLILLTVKEHVIAHWIRWKVLNKREDYISFLFRIGDTEEAYAQRIQLVREARERDRMNQEGFFNSAFQSEMGTRGGRIGGSRNTPQQFRARQTVGLTCRRRRRA